jgi:ubiquinone/menaquinone biosynthesis C-methylase UbiE
MKESTVKRNIKRAIRGLARRHIPGGLYIFGTGRFSGWVVDALKKAKILPAGFFDNNPALTGTLKEDKKIEKPVFIDNAIVILASLWQDEMRDQLIRLGYGDEEIIRIDIDSKKFTYINPGRKVSYLNFGYIPSNKFWKDLKRRFTGIPNLLKRLQTRDIMDTLALRPGETVLDFGCGSGYMTMEIAKIAGKAFGIDISPGIEKINIPIFLKDKLEYIGVSGESLPFDACKFDVILASEILPMIEDAAVFLKEIERVLKPGGRLVIVNGVGRPVLKEAYAGDSEKLRRIMEKYLSRFPRTFEEYEYGLQKIFGTNIKKFLSRQDIISLLEDEGFVVDKVKESPSAFFGSYFEWDQFKKYVKNKNIFKTRFFFLKYLFFSFAGMFSNKTYTGGIICSAHKNAQDRS